MGPMMKMRRKPLIASDAIMVKCFLCGKSFQAGPHAYHGRHVKVWGINFCAPCDEGNHDGIVPDVHPHLVKHLKDIGIEVRLNAKGWIDLPPRGA